MRLCTIEGCTNKAAGFSTLCHRHKRIKRRHGHPSQICITVADLKPYRRRVRDRMVKHSENHAWSILRDRWMRILSIAEGNEAKSSKFRYQRKAHEEIARLGKDVSPDAVIEMTLAMYLLQEDQPRVFRSDRAFDFQLVRRVRGLAETNAGEYWDHKEQRTRRVYRDLPPKSAEIIADYLKATFAVAGLYVARLEEKEMDMERQEKVRLQEALEVMG